MVRVKICGITNLEDARDVVKAGCDSLGFVFYKKSPRFILPQKARQITKGLPKNMLKVGIFVDSSEQAIKQVAKLCALDMLQFHGNESPQFCQKFKGYKIIKAFRIKDKLNLEAVKKYKVFAYLFDTFCPAKIGGTGKRFNWKILQNLDKIKQGIFLSGGLNANNVKEAIKIVRPDWVDVSSSVESKPGKKDYQKVKGFIKVVKNK